MFYQEHEPLHVHAEHQGQRGTFDFDGRPLASDIRSRTALRLIAEWATAHRLERTQIKAGRPLDRIEPLE